MNPELIKYRAWDKLKRKMVYFDHTSTIRMADFTDKANHWSEPMLYSGYKDGCEKPIYEGDILCLNNRLEGREMFCVVEAEGVELYARFLAGQDCEDYRCRKEKWYMLKVISNIHVNADFVTTYESNT